MLRLLALSLLLVTAALASEPQTTAASPTSGLQPPASSLPLDARIARAAGAWPRLVAFLEHNKAKVQAAEEHASRRSIVASRCRALSAMEAYLAQEIPPEARSQLAAYLTVPPEELIADVAAAAAALDELAMHEQVAQVARETASEREQLVKIAEDPKLPAAERAQLKEELAELARTEKALADSGDPSTAAALEAARTHRETIEQWLAWRWK